MSGSFLRQTFLALRLVPTVCQIGTFVGQHCVKTCNACSINQRHRVVTYYLTMTYIAYPHPIFGTVFASGKGIWLSVAVPPASLNQSL